MQHNIPPLNTQTPESISIWAQRVVDKFRELTKEVDSLKARVKELEEKKQ